MLMKPSVDRRGAAVAVLAACVLLAAPRAGLAIDESKVAGIVYNETSGLRATSGGEKAFQDGREKIAEVAYKREGKGMAAPHTPSPEELKYPPAKAAWEASLAAAKAAKGTDAGTCDHIFIWPSSDEGKTPDRKLKTAGIASWPFDESARIKHAYGPIRCPKKVGDVPKSETVYIFLYCGVK